MDIVGLVAGLSAGMQGALFGAAIAIANYGITLWIAARIIADKAAKDGAKSARLIKTIALAELVLLPLAGYLIWPMVLN